MGFVFLNFFKSLCLWILLVLHLSKTQSQVCNRAPFPKYIGAATNGTVGYQMAYHSLTDSLTVCGYS